jgi:hypothetical protein
LKQSWPLAVRVLAVLAAICFVVSFALALLLPATLPLGVMIARIDHMVLVHVQDAVRAYLGDWVWVEVAVPLLARPDWLLPLLLGIVFAGAAVTTASRPTITRSRHRRP